MAMMTSSSVLAAAVCASVLASSAVVDAVPSYRGIEKATTPSISLNTLPAPILKSSTYRVNSDDEMMINRPFAMIEVFEDNKDMPQIIDISMMVVDSSDNVNNSSSGFSSFFDNTFFDDFSMPSLYDLTMPMHDVFDDTFDSIQNFLSPFFSGEESLAATPDVEDVGKKNMNMPTLPTRQVTLRDLTLPVHDFANSIFKSIQNFVAPSPVADDDDNISDENGVVAQLDNEQHEEEEEESTTKEEVNFKKPIWKDEDKEELLARAMLEV